MAFNLISSISSAMVRQPSAFLAASFDIFEWVGELITAIMTILVEIVYFVAKWMMYFTDIIFLYIQQLAGLNTDTSSLGAMFSQDSDMVFNMLIANSTSVTKIIRNLIVMAIVLVLVFSIIAIVKTQWGSIKNGAASVAPIMKNMLKTFLLLFLTPVLAIMGIAATNVILQSLYAATNPSASSSISTRIFAAASGQANAYRIYAVNGERIPITYDFSEEEENIKDYVDGKKDPDEKFSKYVTSFNNAIYRTYTNFQEDKFDSFHDLRVENTAAIENYHLKYDKKVGAEPGPLASYQRLRTYLEEYYVMADVIDYAIESSNPLYMKTIEQVLKSIADLPEAVGKPIFNQMISIYGIEMFKSENLLLPMVNISADSSYEPFKSYEWQVLRFTSQYSKVNEDGTFAGKQVVQYNHIGGTIDEVDGAVFVMAGEKEVVWDDVTYRYFYPLSVGYEANNKPEFRSEYIRRNNIVIAKGIFENSTYPTAIRLDPDGSEVQFYRDTIEISFIGEDSGFLNLDHVEDNSDGNIFTAIGNFLKKLLNPLSMIPELFLNQESVSKYYVKVTKEVNSLTNAKLHIGYLFSDNLTSKISGNMFGLDLSNVFRPTKLNIIVLVVATIAIMRVCFVGMFGLMKRSYELFLLILVYPVTLATTPIDDGKRYQRWTKNFIDKMFITYGLILGINFALLMFPVIESVTWISAKDLASNVAASRVASILGSLNVSLDTQARLLNLVVTIMAELVLFSMIEFDQKGALSIISLITAIVGTPAEEVGKMYVANAGEQMIKTAKKTAIFAGKVTATALFKIPSTVVDMFTPEVKPTRGEEFQKQQQEKAKANAAQDGAKNGKPGGKPADKGGADKGGADKGGGDKGGAKPAGGGGGSGGGGGAKGGGGGKK